MRTAAVALQDLAGGVLAERDRAFRDATRNSLEEAGLTVREIFARATGSASLPKVAGDGTRSLHSFLTITIGIDVDADRDTIEQVCADLTIPGFPTTAWKFPED